jgi:hypothetical protein
VVNDVAVREQRVVIAKDAGFVDSATCRSTGSSIKSAPGGSAGAGFSAAAHGLPTENGRLERFAWEGASNYPKEG